MIELNEFLRTLPEEKTRFSFVTTTVLKETRKPLNFTKAAKSKIHSLFGRSDSLRRELKQS